MGRWCDLLALRDRETDSVDLLANRSPKARAGLGRMVSAVPSLLTPPGRLDPGPLRPGPTVLFGGALLPVHGKVGRSSHGGR